MLLMCTTDCVYLFTFTIHLKTTLDKGLVLATLLASSLFYLLVLFHYHTIPVTVSVTDIRYDVSCVFYLLLLFHYHTIPVTASFTDIRYVSCVFYLWVLVRYYIIPMSASVAVLIHFAR